MAILLKIRKKGTKNFFHYYDTLNMEYSSSDIGIEFNFDKVSFRKRNGAFVFIKGGFSALEVAIYDDTASGIEEVYSNSVDLSNRLIALGYNAYYSDGDVIPVAQPRTFVYSTNTFNRTVFPANSNLVYYPTNYGVGGYANGTTDLGSEDFLVYMNDVTKYNNVAFTAPFDMKLTVNQSLGGFSGSWASYDLRFVFGFFIPLYQSNAPYIVIDSPTVVFDKNTPTTGGYVDMREDITSVIVIPKGASCMYSYAHLRPNGVTHYIKTQLIFEEII